MTKEEYCQYYVDFLTSCIGPSVKREQSISPSIKFDEMENAKNGLIVLCLVSWMESRFFKKSEFKIVRSFTHLKNQILADINQTELSCLVYIRDCFGHHPKGQMFPDGDNTNNFKIAIEEGMLPGLKIHAGILVDIKHCIHPLHTIMLKLFENDT